jgi:hypothetical protein
VLFATPGDASTRVDAVVARCDLRYTVAFAALKVFDASRFCPWRIP